MRIRRLNDAGLDHMQAFLDSLTTEDPNPCPESILTDPATSESLPVTFRIERREFPRRFDLAKYLHDSISGSALREPERDGGLWAWIALYWFEQLCPRGRNGNHKPGERARWIPEVGKSWRSYRHLVLGPYLIYLVHFADPQRAMCLLYTPPHSPGELVGQIAAVAGFVQCPAVVGAATRLYLNADGKLRRGAGGRGPGSAARLRDVLGQFDRTFDLHALDETRLLSILPGEFDRFRHKGTG